MPGRLASEFGLTVLLMIGKGLTVALVIAGTLTVVLTVSTGFKVVLAVAGDGFFAGGKVGRIVIGFEVVLCVVVALVVVLCW